MPVIRCCNQLQMIFSHLMRVTSEMMVRIRLKAATTATANSAATGWKMRCRCLFVTCHKLSVVPSLLSQVHVSELVRVSCSDYPANDHEFGGTKLK